MARGILQGAHLGTRIVLARNPIMRAVREYAMPALTKLPPVRSRFLAMLSQLSIGYRGSTLAVDTAPAGDGRWGIRRDSAGIRAGDRVPDAPLADAATGEQIALFDLIAQGWTLLFLPGRDANRDRITAFERLHQHVRDAVGHEVQSFMVLNAPPELSPEIAVLVDATGEVGRIFGPSQPLAALVRPDGYLGYRGAPDQPGALVSYLARVFAMSISRVAADASAMR